MRKEEIIKEALHKDYENLELVVKKDYYENDLKKIEKYTYDLIEDPLEYCLEEESFSVKSEKDLNDFSIESLCSFIKNNIKAFMKKIYFFRKQDLLIIEASSVYLPKSKKFNINFSLFFKTIDEDFQILNEAKTNGEFLNTKKITRDFWTLSNLNIGLKYIISSLNFEFKNVEVLELNNDFDECICIDLENKIYKSYGPKSFGISKYIKTKILYKNKNIPDLEKVNIAVDFYIEQNTNNLFIKYKVL